MRQVLVARRRVRIGFQPFQLSASCSQRQDCRRSRISHNEYSARHPVVSQLDGGTEEAPLDGQRRLYRLPDVLHRLSKNAKGQPESQPKCMKRKWWPRAELNHRHTDFQYQPPSKLWLPTRRFRNNFLLAAVLSSPDRTPAEPVRRKSGPVTVQRERNHPLTQISTELPPNVAAGTAAGRAAAGLALENVSRGGPEAAKRHTPGAADSGGDRHRPNCPRGTDLAPRRADLLRFTRSESGPSQRAAPSSAMQPIAATGPS